LYLTRFIAEAGIGRGHAAINPAIDEMIPARYRGRVDIGVNGAYWAGSLIGTPVSLLFLNVIGLPLGWRLSFLVGPALAVIIICIPGPAGKPALAAHPRPRRPGRADHRRDRDPVPARHGA